MCPNDSDDDFDMGDDIDIGDEPGSSQPHFNETHVEEISRSGEDTSNDIKILVATDIHVGYGERKKIIDNDAIKTFEEVLKIAHERNVDMVLLGGDLFHENNPSRSVVNKVTSLLRKYCLNDREVALEFMSDPSVNFNQSNFDRVNYEDNNLNVGLPVFTIHGNHDDMTGKGLTALDPLHEAGLLNLFGKFSECDNYVVSPILLRKGSTRLALYGIGSQRDDRLARAFQSHSIQFPRPRADADGWFNILTLHQNRPKRSTLRTTGAYLPDSFIPPFFDLVVWGHEHECKKDAEYVNNSASVAGDGFFILQPGSTVATSLTKDEALPKHVFEITVRGRKFQCKPIGLKTVRKMIVDEIILDTLPQGMMLPAGGLRDAKREMEDEILIKDKIRMMIEESKQTPPPKEQPELPLIRLKVTYTGPWAKLQPVNARRIGASFAAEVANSADMVIVRRIGTTNKKEKKEKREQRGRHTYKGPASVEAMISEDFRSGAFEDRLTVLTDSFMGDVLKLCADDEEASVTKTKQINEQVDAAIQKHRDEVIAKVCGIVEKRAKTCSNPFDIESVENEVRAAMDGYKQWSYAKEYPQLGQQQQQTDDTSTSIKEEPTDVTTLDSDEDL